MKRERGTRTAHVQASTRALPLSRGKLPTLRRVDFVCGYLMKRNRYTLDWTLCTASEAAFLHQQAVASGTNYRRNGPLT
jgi:hypothetical protein